MEMQSEVSHKMLKNSSTSENYRPTQIQLIHHLQPQSKQKGIRPRHQQFPNPFHAQQNNETQKHN